MGHDQRFKGFLQTFLQELLKLFFGREILRFRYESVQLARLDVEEYRKDVGPVGAALG